MAGKRHSKDKSNLALYPAADNFEHEQWAMLGILLPRYLAN